MNKVELIAAMAARSGLSKKETGAALAALVDGISDALKAGERVAIISALLSIPGVCALKIDILGANSLPANLLENCPGIQEPELHC